MIDLKSPDALNQFLSSMGEKAINFGIRVVVTILIFLIGRWVIHIISRWIKRLMTARNVDMGVISFVSSGATIVMYIMLAVGMLSSLGFEVVSFAALLASMGVAIGMALSNDLKNLAGGLVLLITRPIRVGDVIEAQGQLGTVDEIRIFHTILITPDNRKTFVPNGLISSGAIINYSMTDTRRIDRTVSIRYGADFERARLVIEEVIRGDKRILTDTPPLINIETLNNSSVDILVRFWVASPDYWDVMRDFNRDIYEEFNRQDISFPFPTITLVKE